MFPGPVERPKGTKALRGKQRQEGTERNEIIAGSGVFSRGKRVFSIPRELAGGRGAERRQGHGEERREEMPEKQC